MENKKIGSRFGYLMIASGAAIGLGNIWKFPYLAYRGGALFILIYIGIVIIMGKTMVQVETAIGRNGDSDTVTAYEKIDKRWGFIGWIANACTIMINFFYVVVGGWCLKYAFHFAFVGDFGADSSLFFNDFISKPFEPLIWCLSLLIIVLLLLFFGIHKYVEKVSKFILPMLTLLLIVCGIYSCCISDGAIEGIKYYFLPDFSKFTFKTFADAVTQALFSIGIGWGIFVTLGASTKKTQNIRNDAWFICIADTAVAILAGFTIIPTAFASGIDVEKGPALIFEVMVNIFSKLPFGRLFGAFFFLAIILAVISSLFSFIEITVKTFENKLNIGRKKSILITGIIIFLGNVLVSLGFGVLSSCKIPWISFSGVDWLSFYDWFDCFSGYILLPLGCLLTCIFVTKVWGLNNYEIEMQSGCSNYKVNFFTKVVVYMVVPLLMLIVFLNVFGLIK